MSELKYSLWLNIMMSIFSKILILAYIIKPMELRWLIMTLLSSIIIDTTLYILCAQYNKERKKEESNKESKSRKKDIK